MQNDSLIHSDNIWSDIVLFLCLLTLISYGPSYHLAKTLFHCTALVAIFGYAFNSHCRLQLKRFFTPPNWNVIALSIALAVVVILTSKSTEMVAVRFRSDLTSIIIPLIVIMPILKPTKKQHWLIYAGLITATLMLAAVGITDYHLKQPASSYRTSGSINLPIIYATGVAVVGSSTIAIALQALLKNNYYIAAASGLAFITAVLAIIYSGSRGPLLAIAITSMIAMLYYSYKLKRKRLVVISAIFISIASYCVYSYTPIGTRINNAIENTITNPIAYSSSGIRIQLWQAGLSELSRHPLTGTGIAKHIDHFQERYESDSDFIDPRNIGFIHLHNDIINSLVWMGLLAGPLFLIGIYGPAISSIINITRRPEQVMSLCAGLTFIISGLTNTPAMRAAALLPYFLVVFLIFSLSNHEAPSENNSR